MSSKDESHSKVFPDLQDFARNHKVSLDSKRPQFLHIHQMLCKLFLKLLFPKFHCICHISQWDQLQQIQSNQAQDLRVHRTNQISSIEKWEKTKNKI